MKVHHLKTHPQAFDAQTQGRKNFEFRRDDRGFEVGDLLVLHFYDGEKAAYRFPDTFAVEVTYVLSGPDFGVPDGFVVLSTGSVDGKRAADGRALSCIASWLDCVDGTYHPNCCRFPKSCSCGGPR